MLNGHVEVPVGRAHAPAVQDLRREVVRERFRGPPQRRAGRCPNAGVGLGGARTRCNGIPARESVPRHRRGELATSGSVASVHSGPHQVPFGSLKLHSDLLRGIKELGFVKPKPI